MWSSVQPKAVPKIAQALCVAREAMACEFSVFFPDSQGNAVDAACAALDEVERLESKLSIFLPDSDISRVNAAAFSAPVRVDTDAFALLEAAARISFETAGAFDPACGSLVRAWGFANGTKAIPDDNRIGGVLRPNGMGDLELDAAAGTVRYRSQGLELNLGAIGKGFAIDRAVELLRRRFAARSGLIQAGHSSVRALGRPPYEPGWKVAIGDPLRPGRALASVWLEDRALGTSAATHQFFYENGRRCGHILDPRTGRPAEGLASASALAPTCTEADALSTAFFVMGVEETRRYCHRHPGIGAILVTPPHAPGGPQVIAMGLREGELEMPGGKSK